MSIIQLTCYSNSLPASVKAIGGTTYTPGNGYTYHMFITPGTFTVEQGPLTVEALIVAGGGSGGYETNGYQTSGGGAGGVIIQTFTLVTDSSYPISIGSGGSGSSGGQNSGSPTIAFNFSADGGARGNNPNTPGTRYNGGCGSGAVVGPAPVVGFGNVPRKNPTQGYNGGLNTGPSIGGGGGGGGGAGGVGGNASASPIKAGDGGIGISTSGFAAPLFPGMPTDWVNAVGPQGYYGGGGGGSMFSPPNPANVQTQALGGSGGGGKGKIYTPVVVESTSGVDNTGGGGGGGRSGGRSGGPGIVIVRYLV